MPSHFVFVNECPSHFVIPLPLCHSERSEEPCLFYTCLNKYKNAGTHGPGVFIFIFSDHLEALHFSEESPN